VDALDDAGLPGPGPAAAAASGVCVFLARGSHTVRVWPLHTRLRCRTRTNAVSAAPRAHSRDRCEHGDDAACIQLRNLCAFTPTAALARSRRESVLARHPSGFLARCGGVRHRLQDQHSSRCLRLLLSAAHARRARATVRLLDVYGERRRFTARSQHRVTGACGPLSCTHLNMQMPAEWFAVASCRCVVARAGRARSACVPGASTVRVPCARSGSAERESAQWAEVASPC
jgi:hypothetical protein